MNNQSAKTPTPDAPGLPFTVRCPQCGEKFKSATNTANLCLLCECAEYDDVEPTDA